MKNINSGKNNGMWKEKPGRIALHEWVRNRKPKPKFCENCNIKTPKDLANISQKYYRDINDFKWLCRKCHMIEDGRLIILHAIHRKPKVKIKCQNCNKLFMVVWARRNTARSCSLSCNAIYANKRRYNYV